MATTKGKKAAERAPVLVDLALQGGGAHGAYTWGVLDRLLEEPWLSYDGISGTSAGAMNAVVMAFGQAKGLGGVLLDSVIADSHRGAAGGQQRSHGQAGEGGTLDK